MRPKAPENLTTSQLVEWQQLCDDLDDLRRLSVADRAMLTLYIELWGIYQRSLSRVRARGAVITHKHNGVRGLAHDFKVVKDLAKQLRQLLVDMGLDPASRPIGVEDHEGSAIGDF